MGFRVCGWSDWLSGCVVGVRQGFRVCGWSETGFQGVWLQ